MQMEKRPSVEQPAYKVSGNIRYLDDSGLNRPLDMPAQVRRGLVVALALACVIGGAMIFRYFDSIIGAPQRDQEAMQENIAREVSLDLPQLGSFMPMGDQDIMASLNSAGYTLYEKTPVGANEAGGFEVIKLPEGVSLEEAGLVYLAGISNASAADASRLLNGSWTLSVDRSSGTSMRARYADFASGSADAAIQKAKEAEGLSEIQAAEAGVDDAGNTYQAGTVDMNGETYSWRVSVIALSEVYEVSGLPDDALFVGIRFAK